MRNLYTFKSVAKFLWLLYSCCGKGNLLVPILANVIGIIKKRSCRAKGRLDISAGKIPVPVIWCHVDCLGEAGSLGSLTTALKRRHLGPSNFGIYTRNYTLPHPRKLESSSAPLLVPQNSPGSRVTNKVD